MTSLAPCPTLFALAGFRYALAIRALRERPCQPGILRVNRVLNGCSGIARFHGVMIASFALRPGAHALRLPELVGALCRRLRAPELRDLEKIMLSWAAWRARQTGLNIEAEDLTEVNRMENSDDVQAMRIQAAMKFDAETAARLGAVLEGVTDQEVFDGVLAALVECDTPSDLLERVAEVRRRSNGRNAPADC